MNKAIETQPTPPVQYVPIQIQNPSIFDTGTVWFPLFFSVVGGIIGAVLTVIGWTWRVASYKGQVEQVLLAQQNQSELKEISVRTRLDNLQKDNVLLEKNIGEQLEEIDKKMGNLTVKVGHVEMHLAKTNSGFIPRQGRE